VKNLPIRVGKKKGEPEKNKKQRSNDAVNHKTSKPEMTEAFENALPKEKENRAISVPNVSGKKRRRIRVLHKGANKHLASTVSRRSEGGTDRNKPAPNCIYRLSGVGSKLMVALGRQEEAHFD